ncbi:glycosyltransferase [Pseudoxanthomonas japonensis]|jgi:glycosyltransferase involved in cell wall biosynthesis|uniref:glycosyltransferase n=1 Tax=Pseudoxanthomonas japonensis TaxID=69284 RepID=UPI001BD07449|nr:glycosyltransferase [Pseudoxanthomonas japonensis]
MMQTAVFRPASIVHVVDSLEVGGLERVVTDLAIAQQAAGSRVTVFSIADSAGFVPVLEAAGIPVLMGGKSGTLDRKVLARLRQAALGQRVQVVHAHNFVPNYYAALALLGTWRRPALVGTCHDMGMRLANARLRRLYRLSLLRTQRVAMVGRQVHERFVGEGYVRAEDAETLLNGIPLAPFAGSPQRREEARRRLGLGETDLIIGHVGRLVELKNQKALIDCLPALASEFPQLRLVLVGEGPTRDALQAQAASLGVSDRVMLAGARHDISDLLPAFDVFALPSFTEGLSIALLEACASGLAIVATAVGGNPEVIQDGVSGRLVTVGDTAALQAALRELLASPDLRARRGASARDWVAAYASIEALRDAYAGFYARALGTRT